MTTDKKELPPRWAFDKVETARAAYLGVVPNYANVDVWMRDPDAWWHYHMWASSIARQGESFSPATWFAEWLANPLPAAGGRRPIDFMGTVEGRAQVIQWLGAMESGAYV